MHCSLETQRMAAFEFDSTSARGGAGRKIFQRQYGVIETMERTTESENTCSPNPKKSIQILLRPAVWKSPDDNRPFISLSKSGTTEAEQRQNARSKWQHFSWTEWHPDRNHALGSTNRWYMGILLVMFRCRGPWIAKRDVAGLLLPGLLIVFAFVIVFLRGSRI